MSACSRKLVLTEFGYVFSSKLEAFSFSNYNTFCLFVGILKLTYKLTASIKIHKRNKKNNPNNLDVGKRHRRCFGLNPLFHL